MFETVVELSTSGPAQESSGSTVSNDYFTSSDRSPYCHRYKNQESHEDVQSSRSTALPFVSTIPTSPIEDSALQCPTPPRDTRSCATQTEHGSRPDMECYQDIWTCIHEFFETIYIIFPIISYVEIVSRLIVDPDWATSPDLRTMYYTLRLSITTAKCRTTMSSQYRAEAWDLVQQVEASRLTYNFSDPPTLDAVVVSLCLFATYNVLGDDDRSLLYLCEASVLLEAFSPTSTSERERKRRIEMIVFNAESASFEIYAMKGFVPTARRPPERKNTYRAEEELGKDAESEELALCFLQHLTRIYLAENVDDLNAIDPMFENASKPSFGPENPLHHRYASIQAADAAVTHQWLLSYRMVTDRSLNHGLESLAKPDIGSLGVAAMAWAAILAAGDLRIVGLGKMAGLALNMWALGGLETSRDVIHGLTNAVVEQDFDGAYAIALANLIEEITCTVSPWLRPPYDEAPVHGISAELQSISPNEMPNGLFQGHSETAKRDYFLIDPSESCDWEGNLVNSGL